MRESAIDAVLMMNELLFYYATGERVKIKNRDRALVLLLNVRATNRKLVDPVYNHKNPGLFLLFSSHPSEERRKPE